MTKVIVSSTYLFSQLLTLNVSDGEVLIKIKKHSMLIGNAHVNCEANLESDHLISYKSINKLRSILAYLNDQPITIAIDEDNWLYIKEAIL